MLADPEEGPGSKLHWTVSNQWRKIVYSDEMMIVIKPDGKLKVWRKASEKWRPECLGYISCNNVAPVTNLCLGRATTRSHSSQCQWGKKKVAVET